MRVAKLRSNSYDLESIKYRRAASRGKVGYAEKGGSDVQPTIAEFSLT